MPNNNYSFEKVCMEICDVFFSILGIILFAPLLVLVSIILKLVSDDGIIYKQKRIGINGQLFYIYKFTTMLKNSEHMGSGNITLKNDVRVFPFGKLLRKTKINELPQLFNVLKGDMSIIGPRPQDLEGFHDFNESEQTIIIKIKPGLSSVSSVLFRDEDEILEKIVSDDKLEFFKLYIAPFKGRVEAWYVSNRSLRLYFIIIYLTIRIIFNPNYKTQFNKVYNGFPATPDELVGLL